LTVMQSEVEVALSSSSTTGAREQRGSVSGMKKYTKLVLALVAVISSLCFLIYKYRYDRLYHVMQVLEVFGDPNQPLEAASASCSRGSASSVSLSSWQHLGQGLWVFGAHCSTGADRSTVTAVGLLTLPEVEGDLQCALWYEGARHQLQGILSVNTDSLNITTFTCESKYPDKRPYSLAIYRGKVPQGQTPIQPPHEGERSGLGLCLLPDTLDAGDLSPRLRENLILHSLLGVSSLRVYSASVPGSVLDTIASLRARGVSVDLIPWTAPGAMSQAVMESLVGKDCYYHSQTRFEFYTTLRSQQVLIPSGKSDLKESLKTFHSQKGPNKIPVKIFCSEYPTEKKAKNVELPLSSLKSTYYNKELSEKAEGSMIKLSDDDNTIDEPEELSIHEYRECEMYDISEKDESAVHDDSALRFSIELVKYYQQFL